MAQLFDLGLAPAKTACRHSAGQQQDWLQWVDNGFDALD
jgi:hypothetical protein